MTVARDEECGYGLDGMMMVFARWSGGFEMRKHTH